MRAAPRRGRRRTRNRPSRFLNERASGASCTCQRKKARRRRGKTQRCECPRGVRESTLGSATRRLRRDAARPSKSFDLHDALPRSPVRRRGRPAPVSTSLWLGIGRRSRESTVETASLPVDAHRTTRSIALRRRKTFPPLVCARIGARRRAGGVASISPRRVAPLGAELTRGTGTPHTCGARGHTATAGSTCFAGT